MTISQTITALPTPPDPLVDDNTTFPSKASAFTQALVTMRGELNTMISQINTDMANLNSMQRIAARYLFSTTTAAADPGNGTFRLNNATQNLATALYLDTLDANNNNLATLIDTFDDSTSTHKGHIVLQHATDITKWIILNVTGAVTSPTGYKSIVVSVAASSAASPFANGDSIIVSFQRTGDIATGTVSEADVQNRSDTYGTTAGTSSAYTLALTPAPAAYVAGQEFVVVFHQTNAVNATINVNGLGAITLQKLMGGLYQNLAPNDIIAGTRMTLRYNGTTFEVNELRHDTGDVIQFVPFVMDAGTSTTSTTAVNVSASSKSITPKSTNSILLVVFNFNAVIASLASTNVTATFQLMESGSLIGNASPQTAPSAAGGTGLQGPGAMSERLTNTALTARSFTLSAKTSNASAAAQAVNQSCFIVEIQA